MDISEQPLTPSPGSKLKTLVINLQTPSNKNQIQQLTSPIGSELSHTSQSLYSKPTAFITSKEINQAINDLTKNIKEGKYHRAILRMHKLLNPNSSISFAPYQQIKLYRRYFECVRKLTKRYFSQVGMTKSQLSNMEKMCERGSYIIDSWYNVLNDLITQKNEIMQEDLEDVQDPNAIQYTDRTHNTFTQLNSQRNIEQQQTLNEKRSNQNLGEITSTTMLISQRKSSLNKIREVEEEESDANSVNRSFDHIKNISPIHNQQLLQERMERQFEKKQNQKILKKIDFHMNEFFKSNFQIINIWVKFGKKTENYSIYQTSLFKATQWIDKLELTKEEDLINCFGKIYIEIGNYYMQQGSMKECVKNYEQALDFLQKEMMIRGSGEKHQKLLKMSSRKRRKEQDKLQHNVNQSFKKQFYKILMLVTLFHSLSVAEELQENYSRVLETLNIAEWMTSIYLTGYSEIEELIYKANDAAKTKYKDLVLEEGEIHIIMDEALGIRQQKRKTNQMNKTESEDFYSYYSQIFYDKYKVKELNESQYIIHPKQTNLSASVVSESHIGSLSSFANIPAGNQSLSHAKVSAFHSSAHSNNQAALRAKKKQSMPNSFNSINQISGNVNISNLNTKQSIMDETPTKYKIEPSYSASSHRIRDFNSTSNKRNNTTISLLNNTYTPQHHKQSQSMIQSQYSQKNKGSNLYQANQQNIMNATSTATSSPFQQYQFVPFESQNKLQSDINMTKSEILKNIELTHTPNYRRERGNQGARSMTAIGLISTPQAIRNSSFKQEPQKRVTPQSYQPKILTTDKYFNESSMIYYSSSMSKDLFQDKEKTEEEKKQQVRNMMMHKPQVVQNLDIYFKDKINQEFHRLNDKDQSNIEFDLVSKGIGRLMKDESFDKDEFQNAFKLLKLKKQKNQLREGEEVFDKKEPPEIKITTHTLIKNEIYYQESQQNLKQEINSKKAAQKELENQRMAQNLIQEDSTDTDEKNNRKINLKNILFNQRNSSIISVKSIKDDNKPSQSSSIKSKVAYTKNEIEKQQGLNPQQMAKKLINNEIEQIDSQMRREEKEINDLMLPKDRRAESQQQQKRFEGASPNQSQLASQQSLSPLLKKKQPQTAQQVNRSSSRNRKLKFLDNYQDISKSTQLITVKRDVKKATTFVDLAFASYKLQKLGMDRNKLSGTDNNNNMGECHKQTSPASKVAQTLQKSLRKLMKLKTSDLQEGSTPVSHKNNDNLQFSQHHI